MWSELFKRWMDMALWWLPRDQSSTQRRERRPQATETPQRHSPEGVSEQAQPQARQRAPDTASVERPEPTEAAEDLTDIKGIGAAMQKKLESHGIHSHRDLANAEADELVELLRAEQVVISRARVQQWIEAAGEHL